MPTLLVPPVWVAIFVAGMTALRVWMPGPVLFSTPVCWLGLLPAAGGIALSVSAAWQFRRVRANILPFRAPTRLVTDGVFRFSRNPMYLGLSLFLLGLGVLLGTLWPLLAPPLFMALIDRLHVADEERAMLRVFGEDFRRYARHTRRWF